MTRNWLERKEDAVPLQEFFALPLEKNEIAWIYLGFAGIILRSKANTIALDTGKLCLKSDEIRALETLDIQFYSHIHWDHWELQRSLEIFEATGARIIAEPQVVEQLKGKIASDRLTPAQPCELLSIDDFEISPVTGVHGKPITVFRIKTADYSIFHGADSGPIPLEDYPADVAFLPTGTPSPTCSPKKALQMAQDIDPKVAVAIHGRKPQAEKFKELMKKEMPHTIVMTPYVCELVRMSL